LKHLCVSAEGIRHRVILSWWLDIKDMQADYWRQFPYVASCVSDLIYNRPNLFVGEHEIHSERMSRVVVTEDKGVGLPTRLQQ
jgi:hypothetical protein